MSVLEVFLAHKRRRRGKKPATQPDWNRRWNQWETPNGGGWSSWSPEGHNQGIDLLQSIFPNTRVAWLIQEQYFPYIQHKCLFWRFFVVLTFHLPSNLFSARGEGGPQTNWKASGRFPFLWLRRRRRPQDSVQIVVFVGTDNFLRQLRR